MSTFIRVEAEYWRNRKTLRLERSIGRDARWVPLKLWSMCTERRSDDVSSYSAEDLADCLNYDGDAKILRAALIESGFLSQDGAKVAGWEERYGRAMAFHSERASRAAAARWGKASAPASEKPDQTIPYYTSKHDQASFEHATSMPEASLKDGGSAEPSPAKQSVALPDLPPVLASSTSFLAVWTDWIAHRKQIRKPLTPLSAKRQLSELANVGAADAVRYIDRAISSGWQGLTMEKPIGAQGAFAATPPPKPERIYR
jgi:hypothetical protein